MNTFLQLVLPILNLAFVALVVTGKIKITWFPEKKAPQPQVAEVVAPTVEKRKRGRPRKSKTHYLYLPATLSETQLADATEFFESYEDKAGDKVVLYTTTLEGAEESIEVPYPVRWDSQVKEHFSERLGGWV
jgi:hypothetical protein